MGDHLEETSGNGAATSNTIDDEFASLFLQELQNTRAESLRNVPASVTDSTRVGTATTTAAATASQPEIDYMNSMELSASQTNLAMKGTASYAMYLPLETTFNSSFLDLNELYSPGTQQVSLESLMKTGSGSGGVDEGNSNSNNNHHHQDTGLSGDMMEQLKTDKAGFSSAVYHSGYPPATDPDKSGEAISTILGMPTGHTGVSGEVKQEPVPPVVEDIPKGQPLTAGGPEADPELHVVQFISNNVLSLLEVDIEVPSTTTDTISKIQFGGNIAGRLYINPESFVKLSQLRNYLTLMEEANSTQLFCYRRNWISINLAMDLSSLKLIKDEKPFDEISVTLTSSLRKRDSTDPAKVSVIKENEEFMFHKGEVKSAKNIIQVSDTKVTVKYDDLVKMSEENDDVHIVWDQVKFKSATANNRHDAANKYYIIVLEVTFHKFNDDGDDESHARIFESHQVIVRGRNPSFYSKKGDILIGKIKKLSGAKPSNLEVNLSDKLDSSIYPLATHNNSRPTEDPPTTAAAVGNGVPLTDNSYRVPPHAVVETTAPSGHDITIPAQPQDGHDRPSPLNEGKGGSSYQYFRVTDNYYLPPVDVGYFPHYVHHSKQVLKTNVAPLSHDQEIRQQYNYYI